MPNIGRFNARVLAGYRRWQFKGGPMALSSESERLLEQAVAGIPRIAKVIADYPVEFREGALELAERRYQETVCDLGYAEVDAQGWISVVMFRLRSKVAELS